MKYVPDALPGTPGVIAAADGILPTGRGFKNWRSLLRYGGSSGWSIGAAPNALWANNFEDGGRVLAGTATAIYELALSGYSSWTATARLSGITAPTYASQRHEQSDPDNWAFCNVGEVVLATNKFAGSIYKQTARGGSFSSISGSPAAGCLCLFKDFVIAGNVGDYGAITGTQDMVAWSALGDYTTWTPGAACQAGYKRMLEVPGRIVAIMPISADAIAVYKTDAIWIGRYVGPPTTFAWGLVKGAKGCNGSPGYPPPVVDVGRAHFLLGRDDVYLFDGSSMVSIGRDRVRKHMFALLPTVGGILPGSHVTQDVHEGTVTLWHYNLVYNYIYDEWGEIPSSFTTAPVTAVNAAPAWDVDLGAGNGTLNNVQTLVSKSDGLVYNTWISRYDATSASYEDMEFTFSELGANDFSSVLRRLFLVFADDVPTGTPTLSYSRKVALGAASSADGSGTWNSSTCAFDILKTAYWHCTTLTVPGDAEDEIITMEFDLARDGKRVEQKLYRL